MELLQLKYFLELSKTEHLRKTAEEMIVTPSAISTSISRLENELGVKLFDRDGRKIRLNEFGKTYAKYIQQMFDALDSANASLNELTNTEKTTISVYAVNPFLWNNALQAFRSTHPEISVALFALDAGTDGSSAALPSSSNADFYLSAPDTMPDLNLESELLTYSELLLAVSPAHRLAGKKSIRLAEAKDEWFINSPHSTSFRKYCDDLCQLAGFTPKSRIECDYVIRPRMLINENMVCIATSLGRQSKLYDGTVMIPIVDPPASRPFYIFWNKNRYQTKNAIAFKDFMVQYCKENF